MHHTVRFGRFVFDPSSGHLQRDGVAVSLQPLPAKLIGYLVERPNVIVTRDELTAHLWPEVVVTEASLHQVVRRLRKVLGPGLLRTEPRRGYRFVGELEVFATARLPPAVPDSTIGRQVALEALVARLKAGDRLLTLTGPGGVGKTRLAQLLATRLALAGQSVCFVDIAGASDPRELARRVAESTGQSLGAQEEAARVADGLASQGAMVLFLDDLDTVADSAASVLAAWLGRAPELAVVATSRVVLGVRGERLVEVPPLAVPEATALYAERAGRDPDPDTEALVEALDGLPLAIEIAASLARTLTPAQLLERIASHLDVVRVGRPGDRPARHHSLRAVFDASWALLEEDWRSALGQLCAFAGPFRLAHAEAILVVDGPVTDVVLALVDRSLLQPLPDGRLRFLSTVRAYAEPTLAPAALDAARGRLARQLSGRCSPERVRAAQKQAGLSPSGREFSERLGDLVSAAWWAVQCPDPEVAARCALGASTVLRRTGPVAAQVELLTAALSVVEGPSRRSVMLELAHALMRKGAAEASYRCYGELLANAREAGDRAAQAKALVGLANLDCQRGDYVEARVLAEQALAFFGEDANTAGQGDALRCIAEACQAAGDGAGAMAALSHAADLCRESRAHRGLANALANLAAQGLRMGLLADARVHAEEALGLAEDYGHTMLQTYCALTLGSLLAVTGRLDEALTRFVEAREQAEATGDEARAARAQLLIGQAQVDLGNLAAATTAFEDARDRAIRVDHPVWVAEARLQLARLAVPPLTHLDAAVAEAEAAGHTWLVGEALDARAQVALAHGVLDVAQADAQRALQLAREHYSAITVASRLARLGEVGLAAGDALTVQVTAAELREILRTMRCLPTAPLYRRLEAMAPET